MRDCAWEELLRRRLYISRVFYGYNSKRVWRRHGQSYKGHINEPLGFGKQRPKCEGMCP